MELTAGLIAQLKQADGAQQSRLNNFIKTQPQTGAFNLYWILFASLLLLFFSYTFCK